MPLPFPSATMLGLDALMIVYTLWVLSTRRPLGRLGPAVGAVLAAWLVTLHLLLSSESLFPRTISGPAFLLAVFAGVGLVGAVLLLVPAVRELLLGLDQSRLLLLQGIRVFFGAGFLMQAALGDLPRGFGIVDGFTHAAAGFFGLTAAYSVAAGLEGSRRAWFANLFGVADILVVASTLALVLLPEIGPHHSMMYAVFLPAPLWFWFHVVAIRKLVLERAETAPGRVEVTA